MTFVGDNLEKKGHFFPYLFLSIMLHLGVLLASKMIILPPPINPIDYQLAVKLMDVAGPPKITSSKSTKNLKSPRISNRISKTKRSATNIPMTTPITQNQLHSYTKPAGPLAVLEKPASPGINYAPHIAQNFFKEGKEDKLHFPQITYKEVLMEKPKDIGTGPVLKGDPGQIASSSSELGQGKDADDRERYGFKAPDLL